MRVCILILTAGKRHLFVMFSCDTLFMNSEVIEAQIAVAFHYNHKLETGIPSINSSIRYAY